MKLRNYLLLLGEVVKNNPEVLDYEVITSGDDEGNSFNTVAFAPTIGHFSDRDFWSEDELEETDRDPNSICLN